ncbi:hypothetical protein AN958_02904 [Leucoagaricus sp. SymC.cos]|nr:hypothetical protein AN958_02904 [Leucoagaricus sp. SymC.cos]
MYPSGVPYQVNTDTGLIRGVQAGYTICNLTTEIQDSLCQTSFINDVEDFCLCAAIKPNSTVGDVEGEMAAWCTKPSHGMRLIPESALKGVRFMKTPDYVQAVGFIDQTLTNLNGEDYGGEDHFGCAYNAQKGDNQDFPDVYTLNGQVLTYT